jgi:hypothetical protein
MSLLHLEETGPSGGHDRSFGWAVRPARRAAGLLLALLVTGLAVRLLPFSAFVQWSLVLHAFLGLAAIVPLAVYVARHGGFYRADPHGRARAAGRLTALAIALAIVTGLWVAGRSLFARAVPPIDRSLHLIFSLAVAVFALAHLVPVGLRRPDEPQDVPRFLRARRGYLATASLAAAAVLGLAVLASVLHRGPSTTGRLPAGYVAPGGPGRPFAPALGRTANRRATSREALAGSSACGSPRCHPTIYAEWSVSAHGWAAKDVVFRRVSEDVARRNGPLSVRSCESCHEPVSLFTGSEAGTAGLEEGVSCVSCHSIRNGPTNAEGYVVDPPARYLFENFASPPLRYVSEFLIRAYPDHHRGSFRAPVLKASETCASCHQQLVEAETGSQGLLRIQNQYDQWRTSRWNRLDPKAAVECRECHMPLLDGFDAAAAATWRAARNPEGKHRSHRFLGANAYMPVLLELPGAPTQVAMTEQWLHGEYPIPELADRWDKGPVVTVTLEAPETAVVGQPVELRTLVSSRKVGHSYPTGPLDLGHAWIEIEARDQTGNVVFSSGALGSDRSLEPGSVVFRTQSPPAPGTPRESETEVAAMRFASSVPAGASHAGVFSFACPAAPQRPAVAKTKTSVPLSSAGFLSVSARLRYRKLDPVVLERLFPGRSLSAPTVDLARATARIAVYGRR